jgi:hypothetical protein
MGWFELAEHYPDHGMLEKSPWLSISPFVLSANAAGLCLAVISIGIHSAVFIPWSQLSVTGKRCYFDTSVCLRAAAVPTFSLTLRMDDPEADEFFRGHINVLPERDQHLCTVRFLYCCAVLIAATCSAIYLAMNW